MAKDVQTNEIDLILRGISPCCKAPIDESKVIPRGKYKGHGPRYCSKCRKCVLMA